MITDSRSCPSKNLKSASIREIPRGRINNYFYGSYYFCFHRVKMDSKQQVPKNGIEVEHPNDILCGRPKGFSKQPGNRFFRQVINQYRKEYVAGTFHQRKSFPAMILYKIQNENPPGRFLQQDAKTKLWFCLSHREALVKVRKALVDNAPDILDEIASELFSTKTIDHFSENCITKTVNNDSINRNGPVGKSFTQKDQQPAMKNSVKLKECEHSTSEYASCSPVEHNASCSELEVTSFPQKKRARDDSLEISACEKTMKVMHIIRFALSPADKSFCKFQTAYFLTFANHIPFISESSGFTRSFSLQQCP